MTDRFAKGEVCDDTQKIGFAVVVLSVLCSVTPVAAMEYAWSKRFGDADYRWARSIAVDPSENVIPVGIPTVAYFNSLENTYPNPFNPATTIKSSIAERSHVTLKIYNAAGQLVRTLVDEIQAPRPEGFTVRWDGTNSSGQPVASGVHFYRLVTGSFSQTKKTVLLR